jgi:hypothetical protein
VVGGALLKVFKELEDGNLMLVRAWPFDEKLKFVAENALRLVNAILARSSEYGRPGGVEDFASARVDVKGCRRVYKLKL